MLEQWELVIIASVPTYLNISMNAGILMKKYCTIPLILQMLSKVMYHVIMYVSIIEIFMVLNFILLAILSHEL